VPDENKMPAIKSPNGASGNFNQKLKNFFRINTNDSKSSHLSERGLDSLKTNDSKSNGFRNTKFFSTVGRLRSTTTASEGNTLDEAMSPTAHANPYYALQGQPALQHHNDRSSPPSPPDTPSVKIHGAAGSRSHATNATKEELARKLRKVASAPNAHGLFSKGKGSNERPATAELGKEPLVQSPESDGLGLIDKHNGAENASLAVPDKDSLGALPSPGRSPLAFRRTYSSNSIKVRTVEVSPGSFDKIKLIGKGDVGKVYLVREKKSARLYAMKGT
jgi:protein-serine/threonine kinase